MEKSPMQRPEANALARRKETHLNMFREIAAEKGLKPVDTSNWITVDGIKWSKEVDNKSTGTPPITGEVTPNTDGLNIESRRLEEVGTYDINNGIVAFVDAEGQKHVAPATQDRMEALEEANYQKGSMNVPFSNGQEPTDPNLRKRWEQMRSNV